MSEDEITASRRLADRLRSTREFLNLSQQFVAEQTGISRSAVSEMERGARRVESLELKRLADLYRLPVSYFLRDEEEDETAGAEEDPTLEALTRATRAMGEPEKEQVLRFALFLQNFERRGGPPD